MPAAHYVDAVRGHWRIVTVVAVLGAAIFGTLARTQEPVHRAEMRLLVTFGTAVPAPDAPSSADAAARLGVDRRLVEARVRTYVQLANDASVTGPVVADLRLPYSPVELSGRIRASSPLDSVVIDIVVRDADPARAVAICDAVAAELVEIARGEDQSAGILAAPDIRAAGAAIVARESDRIWWGWHVVGGMIGGFAIGVGLAMLSGAFRRTETVDQQIDRGE
jgi:capsular polysaccharide biosynthesis protein